MVHPLKVIVEKEHTLGAGVILQKVLYTYCIEIAGSSAVTRPREAELIITFKIQEQRDHYSLIKDFPIINGRINGP